MATLKSFWDHPFRFWTPPKPSAIPMLLGLASGTPKGKRKALHPTGKFAARFMMITPLMKRQRHLGVAPSACYGRT